MDPPSHALAAATHPNPAAFYAHLASMPFHRHAALGCWIAASAEAVKAVLTDPNCRVRPSHEPVPPALIGSGAERIYRHLVRMNDGSVHGPLKRSIELGLGSLDQERLQHESRRWADMLCRSGEQEPLPGTLGRIAFDLPVYVLSSLLGVPPEQLPEVARLMNAFAPCLSPAGSPALVERGRVAADALLDLFGRVLAGSPGPDRLPLLGNAAQQSAHGPDVVLANTIGLLWQAYEATAGLIGNTLLALARTPDLRRRGAIGGEALRTVLLEVLRLDPPIQNTRRFVAESGMLLGQAVRAGDVILVVLAAANRDGVVNPEPERFDVNRPDRCLYSFGLGPHLCPGQDLALTIAGAGVESCLRHGFDIGAWAAEVAYLPLVNARLPFACREPDA